MASAVVSDNFETGSGAIPLLGGASVENRICSAWVHFDGTGTVYIRDSFNVSSVTDLGTGSYQANFTTSMATSNYCYLMTTQNNTDVGSNGRYTHSVKVYIRTLASSAYDRPTVCVAIFSN